MKKNSSIFMLFFGVFSASSCFASTLTEQLKTPIIATNSNKSMFAKIAHTSKQFMLTHPKKLTLGVCIAGYIAVDFYNWNKGKDFLAVSAAITLRTTWKNSTSWFIEKYHELTGHKEHIALLTKQVAQLKQSMEQTSTIIEKEVTALNNKNIQLQISINVLKTQLELRVHCDIMLNCFKDLEIENNKKLVMLRENAEKDHEAIAIVTDKLHKLLKELQSQFGTSI